MVYVSYELVWAFTKQSGSSGKYHDITPLQPLGSTGNNLGTPASAMAPVVSVLLKENA
jgi:hypothetical protein